MEIKINEWLGTLLFHKICKDNNLDETHRVFKQKVEGTLDQWGHAFNLTDEIPIVESVSVLVIVSDQRYMYKHATASFVIKKSDYDAINAHTTLKDLKFFNTRLQGITGIKLVNVGEKTLNEV